MKEYFNPNISMPAYCKVYIKIQKKSIDFIKKAKNDIYNHKKAKTGNKKYSIFMI